MSTNYSETVLVTGASGKLGGRVLHHLTATLGIPPTQIIATSRSPENLSDWAEKGVQTRKADYSDPANLAEAFQGAKRLLLISVDSLEGNVRLGQHQRAVDAAKAAAVEHIFYTSLPEPEHSLISFAPDHIGTENAIKASGLKWTFLRNGWYFENLLFTMPAALSSGTLYTAAGEGKIAYISRDDLALAAACALVSTGSENQTFTPTGDEALTIENVAHLISEKVHKPLTVVQVPPEAIIAGAKSYGFSESIAAMFASFDVATKAGQLGMITSDFKQLTGKSPQSFSEWLDENAGLFA